MLIIPANIMVTETMALVMGITAGEVRVHLGLITARAMEIPVIIIPAGGLPIMAEAMVVITTPVMQMALILVIQVMETQVTAPEATTMDGPESATIQVPAKITALTIRAQP